jgi:hypothetical protein
MIWAQDFRAGRFQPVLSEVTAAEVAVTPESVRALHAELLVLPADVLDQLGNNLYAVPMAALWE